MGKVVKKIVLTGGPCAGKSSSLDIINNYLKENGYFVLVVQESATELINSGVKPFGEDKISMIDFQDVILKYQLDKENIIENVARNIINKDIVIIFDRGLIDNKAFIGQVEFDKLLNKYNINELDLLNRYDLVIHLETAAKSRFYTKVNNRARSEDKEQAIDLDNKIYNSWIKHRNLKRIGCFENFDDKQKEIINIIDNEFYKNIRTQNKYLINIDNLNIDNEVLYITQYYLDMEIIKDSYDSITEYRIREVKYKDNKSYYYTIQNKYLYGKSIVLKDEVISEEEFNYLLNNNSVLNKVSKVRKYIVYNDKQYNIDIFDDGKVILEGDNKIDKNVFGIDCDVTGKEEFLNYNINLHEKKLLKK